MMKCTGWRNGEILAQVSPENHLLVTELRYDQEKSRLLACRVLLERHLPTACVLVCLAVVDIRGRPWPVIVLALPAVDDATGLRFELAALGESQSALLLCTTPVLNVRSVADATAAPPPSVALRDGPTLLVCDGEHVWRLLVTDVAATLSWSRHDVGGSGTEACAGAQCDFLACCACGAASAFLVHRNACVFTQIGSSSSVGGGDGMANRATPCHANCVGGLSRSSYSIPTEYVPVVTGVKLLPPSAGEIQLLPGLAGGSRLRGASAAREVRDDERRCYVLFSTCHAQIVLADRSGVRWVHDLDSAACDLVWTVSDGRLLVAVVCEDRTCVLLCAGQQQQQQEVLARLANCACAGVVDFGQRAGSRCILVHGRGSSQQEYSGILSDGVETVRFGGADDTGPDYDEEGPAGSQCKVSGRAGGDGYACALSSLDSRWQASVHHSTRLQQRLCAKRLQLRRSCDVARSLGGAVRTQQPHGQRPAANSTGADVSHCMRSRIAPARQDRPYGRSQASQPNSRPLRCNPFLSYFGNLGKTQQRAVAAEASCSSREPGGIGKLLELRCMSSVQNTECPSCQDRRLVFSARNVADGALVRGITFMSVASLHEPAPMSPYLQSIMSEQMDCPTDEVSDADALPNVSAARSKMADAPITHKNVGAWLLPGEQLYMSVVVPMHGRGGCNVSQPGTGALDFLDRLSVQCEYRSENDRTLRTACFSVPYLLRPAHEKA
eukprot:scpid41195/ scgid29884/ 